MCCHPAPPGLSSALSTFLVPQRLVSMTGSPRLLPSLVVSPVLPMGGTVNIVKDRKKGKNFLLSPSLSHPYK